MNNITCKFSCKKCGAEGIEFTVREREPNESLPHWMQFAMSSAVKLSHAKYDLMCDNMTVDLMVPVPDGDIPVGMSHNPKDN